MSESLCNIARSHHELWGKDETTRSKFYIGISMEFLEKSFSQELRLGG